MNARVKRFSRLTFLLLLVAGCVTINLYFPEAEVKDLAQKIEEQVQEQAETKDADNESTAPQGQPPPAEDEPPPVERDEPPRRSSVGLFEGLLGVTAAHAQEVPEPEVTNPAIRKIIDSRAGRLADINRYKSTGVIGENNKGLLEIRDLEALSDLRARAEAQKLVRSENVDREQLYKEVAAVKKIDLSQLDKIRESYADTLRKNARRGDWIQMPDGTWQQKG